MLRNMSRRRVIEESSDFSRNPSSISISMGRVSIKKSREKEIEKWVKWKKGARMDRDPLARLHHRRSTRTTRTPPLLLFVRIYLWRETCFLATWRIVLPCRKSTTTTMGDEHSYSNNPRIFLPPTRFDEDNNDDDDVDDDCDDDDPRHWWTGIRTSTY